MAYLAIGASSLPLAGCSEGAGSNDSQPRVLVFGMDGATWDIIDPMMAAGELPNLQALCERGTRGVLHSRSPASSPVVWSTIFTGRPHEEHGVTDWTTSQSQHRKVKAIWEMASERDLATHVLNVPSTFPPVPVNGVMVSGFPLSGATIGGITGIVAAPDDLSTKRVPAQYRVNAALIRGQMELLEPEAWSDWFEVAVVDRPKWSAALRIKQLNQTRFYLSPVYRQDDQFIVTFPAGARSDLRETLEGRPYIPEGAGWSNYDDPPTASYLAEHLQQVSEIQSDVAASIVARDWELFIFVNTLIDRVSHPYWPYAFPETYEGLRPAMVARHGDALREAYRGADAQLGRVLAAAEGEFYVVIASDHGFQSNLEPTRHIGVHHLDGIYLVAGPGIAAGRGELAQIEDIGPTVLHLLGLPLGEDMQGRVIPEVERDLGLPVATIPSWEDGRARGSEEPVDAATWDQLKGIGYVDSDAPSSE